MSRSLKACSGPSHGDNSVLFNLVQVGVHWKANDALGGALGTVAIQTRVDDEMRGRVFGVYEMAWGFFHAGGIVFGGLLAAFGPEASLAIGLVGTGLVTVAIWLFSSVARRYTLDQ